VPYFEKITLLMPNTFITYKIRITELVIAEKNDQVISKGRVIDTKAPATVIFFAFVGE